jgi:hypothetical protein
VSTAYGRILETMADENMEWYTSVIKKACEELGKAGNRSTGLDDRYEWVCTSTIAEIDKDMIVQDY